MPDVIQAINPVNGENLAAYPIHSARDVQAAIDRAHTAYQSYQSVSMEQRRGYLTRAAELLQERRDELAKLITSEMGKPVVQARGELDICIAICRYYADNAARLLETKKVQVQGARDAEVRLDPIGIVLGIMPWNFPFYQVVRYVAPNLMVGNVCLLKHASNVPGCAQAVETLFRDAGFPADTFQNLFISSSGVAAIIDNPKVRGVTLTGSEAAGRKVAAQAGQQIKRCVLELGGSDPYVVLDDADLATAVKLAVMGRFLNAGQSCTSSKRIIVDQKLAEPFIAALTQAISQIEPGDPMKDETFVGPMSRSDLRDELHDQVERAQKAGAKLLVGGKPLPGKGAYYAPTLLVNVGEDNPAFQEELFGPVASVTIAKDEADALRLANHSRFGLGSTVITKDAERGKRFAARFEAGMCYVNRPTGSPPELPFGGVKDSGIGRELGEHGIMEFLNVRTLFVSQ
jgi:succinate-semialdehyde dehydrogenase / glutarate-semialdehyde dehydrogenase